MHHPKSAQIRKIKRKPRNLPSVHPAFDPKVVFPIFEGRDGSRIEIYPLVFESFMKRIKGREKNAYELEHPEDAYIFEEIALDDGMELWNRAILAFQDALWDLLVWDCWLTNKLRRNGAGKRPLCYGRSYAASGNMDLMVLKERDYAGKIQLFVKFLSIQPFFLDKTDFFVSLKRFVPRFHPDLLEEDPTLVPLDVKFPYKYINFTYFLNVQHLTDAVAFLDYAEREKMDFSTFCDFVYNTCRCRDERSGSRRHVYKLYKNRTSDIYDFKGPDIGYARAAGRSCGIIE